MKKLLVMLILVGSIGGAAYAVGSVSIMRYDFDEEALRVVDWALGDPNDPNDPNDPVAPADAEVDSALSALVVHPVGIEAVDCADTPVYGLRTRSVSQGTLVFTSRMLGTDSGSDAPRGLAMGFDRNWAAEFINDTGSDGFAVFCRTVKNGVVTSTPVVLPGGANVEEAVQYEIVLKKGSGPALFYINGVLVATHNSNVPDVPLNLYFATSLCGGPMFVDDVQFDIVP